MKIAHIHIFARHTTRLSQVVNWHYPNAQESVHRAKQKFKKSINYARKDRKKEEKSTNKWPSRKYFQCN